MVDFDTTRYMDFIEDDDDDSASNGMDILELREKMRAEADQKEEEESKTTNTVVIPVENIEASKYNSIRDVSDERVKAIADSIKSKNRLLNPVIVYKNENGNYTLYSGHTRVAAWKYLMARDSSWPSSIPARIMAAPEGETEKERARSEMEMQSLAEIHRATKHDAEVEVYRANDLWQNYLSESERAEKRESYLAKFKERYSGNPAYETNPEEFIRNNFRPRIEYIRELTGFTASSDKTIRKMLNSALTSAHEEELPDTKEVVVRTRQNKISTKKLVKKLDSVYSYLETFCEQKDISKDIQNKVQQILSMIDSLKDEENQ